MQVEIKLLNNFHGIRQTNVVSRSTRNLTVEEANAIYAVIDKILDNLEEKGAEFWKKKVECENETLFKLVLPGSELPPIPDFDLALEEEDWIVDWTIGD